MFAHETLSWVEQTVRREPSVLEQTVNRIAAQGFSDCPNGLYISLERFL